MFYIISICCTCFSSNNLEIINNNAVNHAYLVNKLSSYIPEIKTDQQFYIKMCKTCCDKIRKHRKINKQSQDNLKQFEGYITKLKQNQSDSYSILEIKLKDIYQHLKHETISDNNIYENSNDVYDIDNISLNSNKVLNCLENVPLPNIYKSGEINDETEDDVTDYNNLNSPLHALYSNFNGYETNELNTSRKTTDGEFLENIQTLNETNFDHTDIETIIHNGYNYDYSTTASNISTETPIIENDFEDNEIEENDDNNDEETIEQTVEVDNSIVNETTESVKSDDSIIEETNKLKTNFNHKPFKCDLCSKHFESVRFLKIHTKTVHLTTYNKTSNNLKCTICSKICKGRSQLIKHTLTHNNERPFQCNICKKGFKSEKNRKAHMMYHTELKYPCSTCSKKFLNESSLKKHLMTHSDPRFKCLICNKAFTIESYLKKHQRTHNEHEKKYKCDKCMKKFLYKLDFITHNLICTTDSNATVET